MACVTNDNAHQIGVMAALPLPLSGRIATSSLCHISNMTKLSSLRAIKDHDEKGLTRLDFVMARYVALIASLPANHISQPKGRHCQDERPTLSKFVR